jgi:hypothetical protein
MTLTLRKWTRPCPCLIDLLLSGLGVQLRGLNAAMVEVALHLVDGDAFPQHLRRPPVAEIAGVDVRQAEVPGCFVDCMPTRVDKLLAIDDYMW